LCQREGRTVVRGEIFGVSDGREKRGEGGGDI